MRKAALLYNPDSGNSQKRLRELESALAVIRGGGVVAELVPTESAGHAEDEVRRAMDSGCDTIFACGGDGTIHNVVQILAGTPVALAVLPMGTANALAHDIELPLNVVGAAKASLQCKPRRIALGRISCADLQGKDGARYFVVAAGIGVDAHLFYKLHTGTKRRMGMAAYYAKAWSLWFSYSMTRFAAEYVESGAEAAQRAEVTELMAVRIRNFGGVVHEMAPGASLNRDDARLIICRTASRLSYLGYVTRCVLGMRWKVPGIDWAYSSNVSCDYLAGADGARDQPTTDQRRIEQRATAHRKIYVEADGELIGTLPAEISVVPDALTLLAPAR